MYPKFAVVPSRKPSARQHVLGVRLEGRPYDHLDALDRVVPGAGDHGVGQPLHRRCRGVVDDEEARHLVTVASGRVPGDAL